MFLIQFICMDNNTHRYKIALFGGSFDPFTEAHRNIVEKAFEIVDEVVIVPTAVDWYRKDKKPWLTTEQKLNIIGIHMSSLKLRDSKTWSLYQGELDKAEFVNSSNMDEFEKERNLSSRGFYDTLIDYKANHYANSSADDEFYFIIGTDQLAYFKKWRNWQYIIKHAKMIVVQGRDGEVVDSDIPHETIIIDEAFAGVSASRIRTEWMKKGVDAYQSYLYYENMNWNYEDILEHTPIFDVVRGPAIKQPYDGTTDLTTILKARFYPIKIKAPDWVTIIVEKDNTFLVEKQFRYGSNSNIEEFPCGMVEKDEDPLDAAVRELEEETGYRLCDKNNVIKMGATNPNPAFMTNTMHYFYVNLNYAKYDVVSQKLDEHEKIIFSWKDKDRFIFDLADDAHAENGRIVPAIALSAVKLYENLKNYPSCG